MRFNNWIQMRAFCLDRYRVSGAVRSRRCADVGNC